MKTIIYRRDAEAQRTKLFWIPAFLLFLFILAARGATITGNISELLGTDSSNAIFSVTGPSPAVYYNNQFWLSKTTSGQLTNGQLNVVITPPGQYSLSFFGFSTTVQLVVPANTNTYDISQMLTNVVVFVSQGISKQVLPGLGMIIVTNNAGAFNETITLENSGAVFTNSTYAVWDMVNGYNRVTIIGLQPASTNLDSWGAITPSSKLDVTGNGSQLTSLTAGNLTGTLPLSVLPAVVITNAWSAGLITNNGIVWGAGGTNPTIALPNGSFYSQTNGQLWVRTNSIWVALGGGGGTGTVTGPASSTNLEVAIFNGTGGNAIIGSGHLLSDYTLLTQIASGSQNGLLSSSDWTTFNNKMDFTGTSNLIVNITTPIDNLATNTQVNLFAVDSDTNPIPVHLGSNLSFTTNADGTLNLNAAGAGGGSATNLSLLTSNYFNINTNLVIMDLATVQTLNLNLETNANVMISNEWNLTNFHGSDAQFGTWNDTNGTWKLNSMQVAGGLLKTNSSAWRGTNANQMDQAILRLDSTLTNVVVTWSATNLQPPQSFTNSLAGGGGGGGGGGGAFTLIAHGATNATANTSKSITLDTTGSKLYVVGVGWSGGNVTISDGGDTFTPLIQAATGGVAWSNQVFYALNPTQVGASVTFTVQVPSGSGYPNMCIAAFADTGTGPMLDVTNGFNGDGTGHNSLTFPTLTPTSTNELGVVSVFWNNSLSLTNIDSGYTISDAYANTEGMAYIIETTGVAKGPTLKFNGNTDVNAGTQVFFLP